MEVFLVYVWLKLDSIVLASMILAAAILFGTIVALWISIFEGKLLRWVPKMAWIFVLCSCLAILLPTSNQAAVMIATHYGAEAIKSDRVQKLLDVAGQMADKWSQEKIDEMTKGEK